MTGSTYKLAVIINCYNYAEYVERAIRSVLAQDRGDCDLIVVDDGSTDGSWEAIGRTGVTAYRIENSRQRRACVFGLERTSAPFVLFLDADDELSPGALDAIIPHLQPSVAKLQFCLSRIDGKNNFLGSAVPEPDTVRMLGDLRKRVLATGVYTSPPTSGNVFRRDLCELLRDADYDDAVDGVILLAAPFFGEVVSLPEELGLYRVHDRNKSGVGRAVDTHQIERHMARFRNMIDHLRAVLQQRSQTSTLDCERLFVYAEKKFVLSVLAGKPERFRQLPKLIGLISREYFTIPRKVLLSSFHALVVLLPTGLARRLIDIRYRPERRTAAAVARALTG